MLLDSLSILSPTAHCTLGSFARSSYVALVCEVALRVNVVVHSAATIRILEGPFPFGDIWLSLPYATLTMTLHIILLQRSLLLLRPLPRMLVVEGRGCD